MKNTHDKRRSFLLVCCAAISLVAGALIPASHSTVKAWKPVTHVHLAEVAMSDALDDGMVTIFRVDYLTGEILDPVGEYAVDENILQSLRANPSQFRAGVIGPDAYPDIVTGQQAIHPDNAQRGGPYVDQWFPWFFEVSQGRGLDSPAVQAFVTGYLTHAVGDIYAHTFVNHFAGGKFELGDNAIKHMVLEGYIGKRTPEPSYDFSIGDGVEVFIFRGLTYAAPGSKLEEQLLVGRGADYSIPAIFSNLRNDLQRDIDDYHTTLDNYDRRIDDKKTAADDCELWDTSCSRAVLHAQADFLEIEKQLFNARHRPVVLYKTCWRDDIDGGLKEWPNVNHEIAEAITFNPAGTDFEKAVEILGEYLEDHLFAMAGAPDDLCGHLPDILPAISELLGTVEVLPFLGQAIQQAKQQMLNYLFERAFGVPFDEVKKYVTNPEFYFDEVMTRGEGTPITLAELNRQILHLSDEGFDHPGESFDYRKFAAAYNTVTITKLLFMKPSEVDRLVRDIEPILHQQLAGTYELQYIDLGFPLTMDTPNAALGYIRSLDESSQWVVNDPDRLILAEIPELYKMIFVSQPGEKVPGQVEFDKFEAQFEERRGLLIDQMNLARENLHSEYLPLKEAFQNVESFIHDSIQQIQSDEIKDSKLDELTVTAKELFDSHCPVNKIALTQRLAEAEEAYESLLVFRAESHRYHTLVDQLPLHNDRWDELISPYTDVADDLAEVQHFLSYDPCRRLSTLLRAVSLKVELNELKVINASLQDISDEISEALSALQYEVQYNRIWHELEVQALEMARQLRDARRNWRYNEASELAVNLIPTLDDTISKTVVSLSTPIDEILPVEFAVSPAITAALTQDDVEQIERHVKEIVQTEIDLWSQLVETLEPRGIISERVAMLNERIETLQLRLREVPRQERIDHIDRWFSRVERAGYTFSEECIVSLHSLDYHQCWQFVLQEEIAEDDLLDFDSMLAAVEQVIHAIEGDVLIIK